MLKKYNFLKEILTEIEDNIREGINVNTLAKKYTLSEGHLRRLFRYSYNRAITGYIKSRKLNASLNDLLKTESSVLDIAVKYDFDYEQSFIRAFKREYGVTPGDLRRLCRNDVVS